MAKQMILALQLGEENALGYAFDQYYPAHCLFAYKVTDNCIQAEEFASEAFIKTQAQNHKLDTYKGIQT
jgi:DNA-directed RNA polymerase specialized sigma24 family protein